MSPLLDLLITLLYWGRDGWERVRREREEVFPYLQQRLTECAARHGESVLSTPGNPISVAMTLDRLADGEAKGAVTRFGSKLFARFVSGTRAIGKGVVKRIGPHEFTNYGSHHDQYPHAYLTAAAALGTTKGEVDAFVAKLDLLLGST